MTKKNGNGIAEKENGGNGEDKDDIYNEKEVEEELDEDEVDSREAAFMEGYDRELDKFKDEQPENRKIKETAKISKEKNAVG